MKVDILPLGALQTNCYLLKTKENSCVVIDPGYDGKKIVEHMKNLGLNPVAVLLTHGHYDHIGGIDEIFSDYPSISVYIGKGEKIIVESMRSMLKNQKCADIIVENALELKDGDTVEVDEITIKTIHTPGHTLGGVSYICKGKMFSGDTIFYEEIGRCDLYSGDYPTMLKTLKKLSRLEGDYEIFPGHGEPTSLSHERKYNEYMIKALAT